jgi:hypothetical protein
MIISPFSSSSSLSNSDKWFQDGVKEFLNEINKKIIPCDKKENGGLLNNNSTSDSAQSGVCCLEFFFYYRKGGSYKNAIWIKVNNIHNKEIWIRVHNGINGKKINVFSTSNSLSCVIHLNCVLLTPVTYGIPQNFKPKGCFMSHVGRIVNPITTWVDIINEIYSLLPCLCNAK